MLDYCCVPLCKCRGMPFSFHQFPKDVKLRKQWIHSIRRKNLKLSQITKNDRVCSAHFRSDDYRTTLLGERSRLKVHAVPSVFPWTPDTGSDVKMREVRARNRGKKEDDLMTRQDTAVLLDTNDLPIAAFEECQSSSVNENVNLPLSSGTGNLFRDVACQTKDSEGVLDIERLLTISGAVQLFTGFDNRDHFYLVFQALGRGRFSLQVFPISPEYCFFLTMMKLRMAKTDKELAYDFGLNVTTVGLIFSVWINFMYCQFKELNIWVDQKTVRENSPMEFKKQYPNTRVILDCTEIPIMKPKSSSAQQETFSTYKNCNTVKVLIGINPSGFVCFISDAYGGSVSDRQLFIKSNIIDLLEEGDSVMVDRGFQIQDLLCSKGVSVNIPPFLKGKRQFSTMENTMTRRIASKRIHIERAIGLGKTYKILQTKLHISKVPLSGRIIFVCYMLCNFRRSIM
ncbi:uncharacterized protein [Anabrus simplex]|uniref:uncharacterized protein n=1 Tax=Anabrus simplex TaxID=316456 RepID=UPI0035A30DDB